MQVQVLALDSEFEKGTRLHLYGSPPLAVAGLPCTLLT